MKKLLIVLALLLPLATYAITVPWNKNVAGKIFPPLVSDFVGIGTTNPVQILDVNGNIRFPATTAATGTIYMGSDRWIHGQDGSQDGNSFFAGNGSGNYTVTGGNNIGIGVSAMAALTSGSSNICLGASCMVNLTSGESNSANGEQGSFNLTTGSRNSSFGPSSLYYNVTGDQNTAFGYSAGPSSGFTNLSNTLSLGAYSHADCSNCGALGSNNDFGGIAPVRLGLGTNTPVAKLDIYGRVSSQENLLHISSSSNARLVTIDFRGNVGIGTTTPYAPLSVVGQVVAPYYTATSTTATSTFAGSVKVGTDNTDQLVVGSSNLSSWDYQGVLSFFPNLVVNANGGGTVLQLLRYANDDGSSASLLFSKSRGTVEAPTPVEDGDSLGNIHASGVYDGVKSNIAASIEFLVDGVPGASSLPSKIRFITTPDGTLAPTQRMVIDNRGRVSIANETPDPKTMLSVNSTTTDSSSYSFKARDSASVDVLVVTGAGKVGVGTATPGTNFAVTGTFNVDSAATSTFGNASTPGFGINLTNGGCYAIAGVCIGSGSGVSGGTAGMLTSWTSSSALTATSGPTFEYFTATSTTATSTLAGMFSQGSTTPPGNTKFMVATSGAPALFVNQLGQTMIGGAYANLFGAGLTVRGNMFGPWTNNKWYISNFDNSGYFMGMDSDATNRVLRIINADNDAVASNRGIEFVTGSGGGTVKGNILAGGNWTIGTSSGSAKLTVFSGLSNAFPDPAGDDLAIHGSGNTAMSILTPNTNTGGFYVGDPQNAIIAGMNYSHGTDSWTIKGNNATRVTINSVGGMGLGTTSPLGGMLTISTSTGQQLSLTDTTLGNNQYSFRSVGGNFYLSTTSAVTLATATTPIMSVVNGFTGFGTVNPPAPLSVQGFTSNTTSIFQVATSTGKPVFDIMGNGHTKYTGPLPVVSACGTSPTNQGNDARGRIYVGTGVPTTCTLTFASAYDVAPICQALFEVDVVGADIQASSTQTTLVFTSSALLSSKPIIYSCDGI